MLGNLLPGVREVRTPLATGYLWLLILWLWLPAHFKEIPPISGVPGDIAHLAHYGGRVSVGIAISFIAYLIGILSQFLNFPLVRIGTFAAYLPTLITSTQRRFSLDLFIISAAVAMVPIPTPALDNEEDEQARHDSEYQRKLALEAGRFSAKGIVSLQNFIADVSKKPDRSKWNKQDYEFLTYLIREVPNEGNALVGRENELYSVYDRLISEYQFRIGISLPLTALITTLAIRWSLLWLLATLPLLVLLAAGSQQRMAAGDILADAVRLKRIEIALPSEFSQPIEI